jgi:hypothetical protein
MAMPILAGCAASLWLMLSVLYAEARKIRWWRTANLHAGIKNQTEIAPGVNFVGFGPM